MINILQDNDNLLHLEINQRPCFSLLGVMQRVFPYPIKETLIVCSVLCYRIDQEKMQTQNGGQVPQVTVYKREQLKENKMDSITIIFITPSGYFCQRYFKIQDNMQQRISKRMEVRELCY